MKQFLIIVMAILVALLIWNVGVDMYIDAKHDPEIERLEKAAKEAQDAHAIYQ